MRLREIHGNDVVILTLDEAQEQGLTMSDIALPTLAITNPVIATPPQIQKSGKEARRLRRKQKGFKKLWRMLGLGNCLIINNG